MILFLLSLLSPSHCANIFVGAFLGGSHFTAIYDLALILADAGHNITFVNLESGQLEESVPHPNVHGIDIVVWDGADKDLMWTKCMSGLVQADSGDLVKFASDGCTRVWTEIWRRSASVYTGNKVLDIFARSQFDVILGEKAEYSGLTVLSVLTNVPVVNFESTLFVRQALLHNNLPMLLNSQPSIVFNKRFHKSPLFMERLSGLINIFRMLPFIKTGPQALQPFLEQSGFSSLEDVKDSIKLFLTNDHPALTFPFLRSPNDIPIGCANLLGSKHAPIEFSPPIQQFLEESAGKDVVYVSFGSHVKMDKVFWYSELMDILIKLDLRVIVRVGKKIDNNVPKTILPLNWAPQKDLLRSGRVKLFVSHCGNNGRLETIFYNVPVLCIPLYGDQPLNAELVKLNGFGETLMKEDISVKAKDLVATMIAHHESYRAKMKKASDIVENEPGNVRDNLVFYVEHVAKFKNMDYLVNKVIRQQSFIDSYNIDIILLFSLILLVFVVLIFYSLFRLSKYCGMLFCFYLKKEKSQ